MVLIPSHANLPLIIQFIGSKSVGNPTEELPTVLNAYSLFFITGAVTLPTAITSYSIAGEKLQKSISLFSRHRQLNGKFCNRVSRFCLGKEYVVGIVLDMIAWKGMLKSDL